MVVFFLIILLAGMLINIGLITKISFYANYDKKFQEDHASASVLSMFKKEYKEEYLDYINNYEGVIESEAREIKIVKGEILFEHSLLEQQLLIDDMKKPRNIAKHKMIESLESPGEACVYLPYVMKTAGGLKLGDTFQMNINQESYFYTVAGFYEDYNTGRFSFGYMGIMLDHESYIQLKEDNQYVYDGILLMERLSDISENEKFFSDLQQYISLHNADGEVSMKGFSATETKANTMTTATILISVVIAFACVITLISMIIIRFKVSYTIREEIHNIGFLKTIGYTNNQLIVVYMIQFGGTAFLASVLGIVSSNFILPFLSKIITVNAGVIWNPKLDLGISLIVILLISQMACITSMLSANKLKKTPPIVAIRGGITNHSYKKNYFALAKCRGELNLLLSMKSMIQAGRQNLMTILTIAGVSFIACFSLVLFQNMAVDKTEFVDLISGEFSSIKLTVGEDVYNPTLKQELLEQKGVRKVSFYDLFAKGYVENNRAIKFFASENFDDVENKKCYEGRDPEFDNEIVLNGYLASQLGKKVGDTIWVSYGRHNYEYLITGLMQSGNSDGSEGELTIEGYWHINPSYEMRTLNVYTEENEDVDSIIESLKNHFGNRFSYYVNMDESIESMTKNFSQMSIILVIGVIIITLCIISLIISLTTKTTIISQVQEIGIKKALGFTTAQLKLQLTMSMLPVIAIGTVLGSLLCYITVNPMISVLMRGMGIMRANFVIPVGLMAILCVGLLFFAFVFSLFVTRKINKISAYQLMNE